MNNTNSQKGKRDSRARKPQSDGKYRTSDLYYAAFLKTAGVPLLGTEGNGNKVVFVFEAKLDDGENSLAALKNGWFNRTAKVPALTYADEIRTVKALTYA